MRLNIPLEDYTDGVREIIMTPYDLEYNTALAISNEKDLKTALELLQKKNVLPIKRKAIEAEIKIRKLPEPEIRDTGWEKQFALQWKEVCWLFKKKPKLEKNIYIDAR